MIFNPFFNTLLMSFCLIVLIFLLIKSRKQDSCQYWALRLFFIFGIIANVYMIFNNTINKNHLTFDIFITQFGFFSLICALLLDHAILKKRIIKKQQFNKRVSAIFKLKKG